jgi:hypothetical protein
MKKLYWAANHDDTKPRSWSVIHCTVAGRVAGWHVDYSCCVQRWPCYDSGRQTRSDGNRWGQARRAMKREQSAGETCSGSPAGSGRQHRTTRLKSTGNHTFAVEYTRTRPNLSRLDQTRVWPSTCYVRPENALANFPERG